MRKTDKAKPQIRAEVAYPFHVIKRQFGYNKVRSWGLAKHTARLNGRSRASTPQQPAWRYSGEGNIKEDSNPWIARLPLTEGYSHRLLHAFLSGS